MLQMIVEILLLLALIIIIVSLPLAPERGVSKAPSDEESAFESEPMPLRELTCTVFPKPDVTLQAFP